MWWYAIITPIKGHRSFWGLTNQRASCIAWQLCLTIHNFRLLTKAPRTLMTKLPSNYLLKLRPLHLVLCVFGHVLPKGARGWITSSGSRSIKSYPQRPNRSPLFQQDHVQSCFTKHSIHHQTTVCQIRPPMEGLKQKETTALNNYLSSDSIITDRGPGGTQGTMKEDVKLKTIRHHSPLCTCAGLAGA